MRKESQPVLRAATPHEHDYGVTNEIVPDAKAGTRSQVVRLIEAHPDVKQVRLDLNEHSVSVGFYEPPSQETLNRIAADVRAALTGEWDVSITSDDNSPTIHLHKIGDYTTEFHRAHPSAEPPVIWKRIPLPTWRNRPFPRPVRRDYRVMLLLAAICGLSALAGFLLSRAGIRGEFVALFFASGLSQRRLVRDSRCLACAQAWQDRHSISYGRRCHRRPLR